MEGVSGSTSRALAGAWRCDEEIAAKLTELPQPECGLSSMHETDSSDQVRASGSTRIRAREAIGESVI